MKQRLWMLGFAVCASVAVARDIGYIETFSLATNREAALRELVPGTDDWFYFHALHAQNTGARERFQEFMDRWQRERKGGIPANARELLNRQALLDYERAPQKSLDYLRRELGLSFNHARKTGERRSNAPSSLNQNLISVETLLKRALSWDRNSLERIEEAGLSVVNTGAINEDQRRNLLARLRRPDYPGLVDLILADLDYRDSRGFGHHEIHRRLTLAQLDDLLARRPTLRNETAFVNVYLARLAPADEVDLETDAAEREAYLDRVWTFVKPLDPVHNSLKANVLYNRLKHDRRKGVYDTERAMEYIKLPRDVPYLNDTIRRQLPRGDFMARLNQDFGLIALPPVADEEPLLRETLLRLLRDAPDYETLRPWLRDDFLKRIFAEAKLVNGVGDPAQWSPLLTPDEFKRLKERVDIEFDPANPEVFAADAPVRITAHVKNVSMLMIKVFEINTLNYYRDTHRPLNLAINLDGLVASASRREEYREAPERRVARTFDFPELKNRGVYVIELIGNGRSSRVLVQKGRLEALQDLTPAGHAFTILDEAGQRVADARGWLGDREFTAGRDGRLVVPFTTAPRSEHLIVHQNGFAVRVPFQHQAENYTLSAGLYVDREALMSRATAQALLRPRLLVAGRPASLKLLEEPRLVLRSTDLWGIVTERDLPLPALREDGETVCDFKVPEQAVSVSLTLKARIQNLSRARKEDLAESVTFALNEIERGSAVQDLHLGRGADGYWVELLGKNGEPRPGEPLACAFKHRLFRDEVEVELKTDERGIAWLGALDGLERVRVREPFGVSHDWFLARDTAMPPAVLHGRAGETLRTPWLFGAPAAGDLSLLETRRGQFVKDWRDAVTVRDGMIELSGLPAGDYSLWTRPDGRELAVVITDGSAADGFALSPRRALELPRLAPLHIVNVATGRDAVEIRLTNVTAFTRVHVLATRYLPAYDVFAQLGAAQPGLLRQDRSAPRTFYESGRDIGDEYRYILDRQLARKFPGNMLERPGLLLNPWALRDTEAQKEIVAQGGEYAGRAAGERGSALAATAEAPAGVGGPGGFAALDFLETPAVVILNARPDKAGVVRVPLAGLKDKSHLRIMAVDPTATVLRHAALPERAPGLRDRRLADGLDPARRYAERKLVTPTPAGKPFAIADVTTARFESYDTLAKAFRLLGTLSGNSELDTFSFITRWPELKPEEQRELYSKHACHELSFFLYHKDPAFFKQVIAPYLANKKDQTFMDEWLLGAELKGYLEPWRFGRLNAVERILLGRRLAEQRPVIARDARERADLIAPDMEDFNQRFDTALQAGALEGQGDMGDAIDAIREDEDVRKQDKLRAFGRISTVGGAMPAVAFAMPAPSAPAPRSEATADLFMADGAMRAKGMLNELAAGKPGDRRALYRARADRDEAGAVMPEEIAQAEGYFYEDAEPARQQARRFFQTLEPTKEWAENNYYHLPIERQTADLVTINAFWADYAAHDGRAPFLSAAFPQATRNLTEMLLALAVLDLPFQAASAKEGLEGLRYTVTPAAPALMFHREIRETPVAERPAAVLVAQQFFRADDRYRFENNERFDKPVTDEFLTHVVYGAQVVLTNPGGDRQKLQLLLQIPMGALPVNGGFRTRGFPVILEPYTTRTFEYHFYFPGTGVYPHYPATVARQDEVAAAAAPASFRVVEKLSQVDKTAWAWISQNGTEDETIAYLDVANLHRLDLGEIAWRMKDAAFFRRALALLDARHVYQDTLWSYGILHNEPTAINAFLRHSPFATRCGLRLASPLLTLDPVERYVYQHLEYAPLVNPRAHMLGPRRTILNDRFRGQYQQFMKVLSYGPVVNDADALAVTGYLLLQDRIGEALDWFARVDRARIHERLQYDYVDAWLAVSLGDVARARRLAKAHAGEGVDRWRRRFEQVLAQLDEAAGAGATAGDPENRDQAQDTLAATAPTLGLRVEAGKVLLDYRNLAACTLNFYPMDIELLFSRSPFLQQGAAQFAFVQPLAARAVTLPAGRDTLAVELPPEFRARNVMVEAVGAGVRQAQAYYANTLRVQTIEAYGQLVVNHAETRKPVSGAYVKVYVRSAGGATRFLKDGYTDLRGRFDYVSVNGGEGGDVERLAILIMSDDYGAVVREVAPPKR